MIREFFSGFHTEALIVAWYLMIPGALTFLMMLWTSLSRFARAQGEEPPFLFCMLMLSTAAFLTGVAGTFVEQWVVFAALLIGATAMLILWVALCAALFYPRVWRWTRPGLSAFMQPFIFAVLGIVISIVFRLIYNVAALTIGGVLYYLQTL